MVARQEEESRCVVPVRSPKKTIRLNRFLDGGTRRRTTEDSILHVVRTTRLTRTDDIKSSEAREGRRGKLKFSIASTASRSILRIRRNETGTWQRDCSLFAHVNASALCKPSIEKIDGHLEPAASGGARRSIRQKKRWKMIRARFRTTIAPVPSQPRSEFNFAVKKKESRYYRFDDDVVGHEKIESVTQRNFYRALSLWIEWSLRRNEELFFNLIHTHIVRRRMVIIFNIYSII